jgi:hypothetical protein
LNKGKRVEKADLCEWTSQALHKALTPKNILSAFRKTGIWPLNENVATSRTQPSTGFEEGQFGFEAPTAEDFDQIDATDEEEEMRREEAGQQPRRRANSGQQQPGSVDYRSSWRW